MAYYRKRGRMWRAEIERRGLKPESRTFPTKAEAVAWATELEAEILAGRRGAVVRRTVAQALQRYALEVSPSKRGGQWEKVRLVKLERELGAAADKYLEDLQPADLAAWRDRALRGEGPPRPRRRSDGGVTLLSPKPIAGASVRREMGLLRAVFEVARKEWGWLRANPLDGVGRPANGRPRTRVFSVAEQERILLSLGYDRGLPAASVTQRVGAAFLWAIETGMRAGELLNLTWDQVLVEARYAQLDRTKNGDARDVPLSKTALAILDDLPRINGAVFGVPTKSLDVLFRRARDRAGVEGATFHDARATFTTRTAKKLDILELARVLGHRDPRSLMVYYRASASELAARLD